MDHHGTLVAILLGTNFVNNMTAILVNRVAQAYELPAASVIAVVISTVVVLILGEITPKTIAFTKAEALAPKAARLLSYLIAPLRPFIFVIRGVSGRLLRLFGKGVQSVAITVEEYRTFLAMGEKAGAFPARELDMLNGILALRETKASQAMTPRVEVCTVDASDDIESVYVRMRQARHRRLPVVDGDLDNVVGVLNCANLLRLSPSQEQHWQERCLDTPLFLPEMASLSQVLGQLRARRAPIAMMVDEFGGVSGLLSTEDIIEEILGDELLDEFDRPPPEIARIQEGHWRLDGRMAATEVAAAIPGFELGESNANTMSGLVTEGLGAVPETGDTWANGEYQIKVFRVRRGRILEVDVIREVTGD